MGNRTTEKCVGKAVNNFISWEDGFKKEAEIRFDTDVKKLCNYGIGCLDDALVCINRGELVIIGADSGVGKTEIALQIANHNAKLGKKVALYHLEGGSIEAIARMKWKMICEEYYSNHYGKHIEMDYRKWSVNCDQDKMLVDIESRVWDKYKNSYGKGIYFYDFKEDVTLTDFLASLLDFHDLKTAAGNFYSNDQRREGFDLDLIVIDHLQYFSLEQAESEITEITNIIREVKKVTKNYKIPVVLISHLRKKTKDRGLPDQQDFYGSSNIPKISDTSITITPKINSEDFANNIYPTWIRIVKSRVGVRSSIGMLANFDGKKKEYESHYNLYRINGDGFCSSEPLSESELPRWAKHKMKGEPVEFKNWQDK